MAKMANLKSSGRTTSDRTNVGVAQTHAKSMAAGRGGAGAGAGKTYHPGQPVNMAGKGLNTGHTSTNC